MAISDIQLQSVVIGHLLQLLLVLVAVFETMLVHYMLKKQRDMLAINVDLSSRVVLPCVLYPAITISTLICFVHMRLGVLMLVIGICVSATSMCYLVSRAQKRQQRQQLGTVAAFLKVINANQCESVPISAKSSDKQCQKQ